MPTSQSDSGGSCKNMATEESEGSPCGHHSSEVAFLSPCLFVSFTPQLLRPSFPSLHHGTGRPGSEMLYVTPGSSLGHTSLLSKSHQHSQDRGSAMNRSDLENMHGGTQAPRCVCQGRQCQGHFTSSKRLLFSTCFSVFEKAYVWRSGVEC